jgi:TolA-binding protein
MYCELTSSFYLCHDILLIVRYCDRCGYRLSLETEKYCPECGTAIIFDASSASDRGLDTSSKRDEIHIDGVDRNVSGVGVSGRENMFGGVQYNVKGDVIIVAPEYMPHLNNIRSKSLQLEPSSHNDRLQNAEILSTDTKTIERLLQDIDNVDTQTGEHIKRIRSGDVEISRTELTLKDIIVGGNEYYYKGDHLKAIQYYDRALDLDDKYVDAWNNKGRAIYHLGKYDEAIKCFDEAIRNDKGNVNAWNNKGRALYRLGKYDEAIKCFDEAIRNDKDYVNAWKNKGRALKKLGKRKEAEECYETAKKLG